MEFGEYLDSPFNKKREKAIALGAKDLKGSYKERRRFCVVLQNNAEIHFGTDGELTYIDYPFDLRAKERWYNINSKLKNKRGQYYIDIPTSAIYWNYRILWS